jgi:hypothetical protein
MANFQSGAMVIPNSFASQSARLTRWERPAGRILSKPQPPLINRSFSEVLIVIMPNLMPIHATEIV